MVLPEDVTRTLFVAPSEVLHLRLSALEADLDGGTSLGWALAYGTLVLAVDAHSCHRLPAIEWRHDGKWSYCKNTCFLSHIGVFRCWVDGMWELP